MQDMFGDLARAATSRRRLLRLGTCGPLAAFAGGLGFAHTAGAAPAWPVFAEEPLPAATETVDAADDEELDGRLAAARAGTCIRLTGSAYGPRVVTRQIGNHGSQARAAIVAATPLGAHVLGNWEIRASGWTLKGLAFEPGSGLRVAVGDLGVAKGYFRLTRCRIDLTGTESLGVSSGHSNGWWSGGVDYCTILGALRSVGIYINTRADRNLVIHHNHIHRYTGEISSDGFATAHGMFLGTEDRASGWRVATVAYNLLEAGTSPHSYAIEIKGSRTLVLNNQISGTSNAIQHRHGFLCRFVGNISTAGAGPGTTNRDGAALAYGYGDLWADNRLWAGVLKVKMGNYSPVDWIGGLAPPGSGRAPDRLTTYYDRYGDELAGDPPRDASPSPRPACTRSLFVGNEVPAGTIVGQADAEDVARVDAVVRIRARPASRCLIRDHTGPIIRNRAKYLIPNVAAAFAGPWPAQVRCVDAGTLPRPADYPAGFPHAGEPFPARYVPTALDRGNTGVEAA